MPVNTLCVLGNALNQIHEKPAPGRNELRVDIRPRIVRNNKSKAKMPPENLPKTASRSFGHMNRNQHDSEQVLRKTSDRPNNQPTVMDELQSTAG